MLDPESRVAEIYGTARISERHRHRYEVNIAYRDTLEAAGLRFSGADFRCNGLAHVVPLLARCLSRRRHGLIGGRVIPPGGVADHVHVRIPGDAEVVINDYRAIACVLHRQLADHVGRRGARGPEERPRRNDL